MCCEWTYSGVGAKEVHQNVVLRTKIAHRSCGAAALKWEALKL